MLIFPAESPSIVSVVDASKEHRRNDADSRKQKHLEK